MIVLAFKRCLFIFSANVFNYNSLSLEWRNALKMLILIALLFASVGGTIMRVVMFSYGLRHHD